MGRAPLGEGDGEGEMRVSLTFEYVTDAGMRPWLRLRLWSNLKDAFAYFGFRQLLRGRGKACE